LLRSIQFRLSSISINVVDAPFFTEQKISDPDNVSMPDHITADYTVTRLPHQGKYHVFDLIAKSGRKCKIRLKVKRFFMLIPSLSVAAKRKPRVASRFSQTDSDSW